MVRPLSTVWTHFIEYRDGERNKRTAKCKYCEKIYLVPNATKMSKHIEVCKQKPIVVSMPIFSNIESGDEPSVIVGSQEMLIGPKSISVDQGFSGTVSGNSSSSLPTSGVIPDSVASCSETQPSKNTLLRSYFDSVSRTEAEKLDSAFAKAIYASNMPLSLPDNTYWQQFFQLIRPAYKVPSRHDLSNRLLDEQYEEVSCFVNEQIRKADFVTIVSDGWSNLRNESIVSYVVTTPSPLFYKCLETKENRHTASYISQELLNVIDEIGAQKVAALVTDNSHNMKASWQLVQAQYTHIFTISCVAHGLNLLLGDIYKIKTFQMILSNAKEVIKYVKNKQALLSVFTSKQKLKRGSAASTLKLPGETRWCSSLIMFQSLLNGKESLQETVLVEDLNVEKKIRQLILDNDIFWMSINSFVNLLTPICDGIKRIESDNATLSDVPNVFFSIKQSLSSLILTPLQTEEEEAVKTLVENRCNMICQPIHFATYLLDPRYIERDLDEDFRSGLNFLSSLTLSEATANILADFAQYKAHDSIYNNDSVWQSAKLVTPLVWWKGFFKGQCLSSVASRLFRIPPSSAACERIFSAFSQTHTLKRNRLSNERVSKLVSIRSNLILQSKSLSVDNFEIESD